MTFLGSTFEWARHLPNLLGPRRRRWSVADGRAHLELRQLDGPQLAALGRRLESVARSPGVHWIEVNPFTNRLVVSFDAECWDVEELVSLLADAERACGVDDQPFSADAPEHPGDIEPLLRCVIELGADVAGFWIAVLGRLTAFRVTPLQIDLLAAFSMLEGTPRLRKLVDERIGIQASSLVLGVANALAQGLVQSPIGPAVDIAYRTLQVGERLTRLRVWREREPALCAAPRAHALDTAPVDMRPAPLPAGPIEKYAEIALAGSVGAFGLGVATTGSVADAVAPLLLGLPRPARLGREAFASMLGRALAARGVLALDPAALRRLDRVDCLVACASVLGDPDAEELLASARAAGLRVVVATEAATPASVSDLAATVIPGGAALADGVRVLQREGRVVLLVAEETSPALRVADCGIGLVRSGRHTPPWSAHLLAGATLDDARVVVEACAAARETSRQSVTIAEAGAGAGLVLAFGGLRWRATTRVMTAVNLATLVAMANGIRLAWGVDARPRPPRVDRTPWHRLDVEEVLARLATSRAGLTPAEAQRRRLPVAPAASSLERLGRAVVDQLGNPLTPFLAAGAGLAAAAGSVADAAMVGGVMAINAVIGGAQQLRTENAIDELAGYQRHAVRVRRGGIESSVEETALVPGDIVVLRAGDLVRADCRILEAVGLEVDESSLTGESLPVAKNAAPSDAEAVAERTCMLYEGTAVAAGRVTAVVLAVGDDTEARRALRVGVALRSKGGVEARLESLMRFSGPAALVSGLAVGAADLYRGRPLREVVTAGVSLAVAAVPEGLPLLATAAQLAAARRLSKRGVLVRSPRAIEALGRVDVVCLDKTGTLTEGSIRLRSISDGLREEACERLGQSGREILTTALRATPEAMPGENLPHFTDRALVEGARQTAVGRGATWQPLAELPFEPGRGFHAVVGHVGTGFMLCVKGAPEVILPRCTTWARAAGGSVPDPIERERLGMEAHRLARRGLRVLAVAERSLEKNGSLDEARVTRLTFRGFVTFDDPVRPSAKAAAGGLRRAGVRVVMITGDHPSTAESIAAELGLDAAGAVLTGAELDHMDDHRLDAAVARTAVFARVTPAHKTRIVEALQRNGRVVAMTGDGANDAAAIRIANVGIALGRRGTSAASAARRAADLVVTDDKIETLVDAVLEGRAMWASVRDAVAILVGGNLGEIGFVLASGLLGGPALNARQLLLVNLLTDAAPAMAIALRPPPDITPEALLREGPEASLGRSLERDIARRALVTAAGTGAAWIVARATGSRARASSVALATLVGTQLGQTLAAGGRSPLVLAAGLGSIGALVAIVQTPGLSHFFGCRPLGPVGWVTAATASVAATGAALLMPPQALSLIEPWLERRGILTPAERDLPGLAPAAASAAAGA